MSHRDRISRAFTLSALAVATVAAIIVPLLAIQWANRPFLGILVEPTLVVTGTYDPQWNGWSAGMRFPERIIRMAGVAIESTDDYHAILLANANVVGQKIRVLTQLPDGSERSYPSIGLGKFQEEDLLRFFGLPYVVGLAYLAIGGWVFRVRSHSHPARALAFFCFSASVACFLLFDLFSTHDAPWLWSGALALSGGALFSLALRFPGESRAVTRWPWLLFLPYGTAAVLAGLAVLALADVSHPWAYLDAWGKIYTFDGLAVVLFLAVMVYQAVLGASALVRQQGRIVLAGSLIAFGPITANFLAPLVGISLAWNAVLYMPELLLFPLSLAVAIFRYRLLDTQVILNRTLVYGTATALLAGAFGISLGLWQKLFVALTGEKSDTAIIVSSLLVASAFSPLKLRLQAIVDRRLKQVPDSTLRLQSFADELRAYTEMREARQVARRLLEEAARGLQADSGSISLLTAEGMQVIDSYGHWRGDARLCLPIEHEGRRLGLLSLGARRDHRPYDQREGEIVRRATAEAARAIYLDLSPWLTPANLPERVSLTPLEQEAV